MRLHHIGIVIGSEEDIAVWREMFGLREICRDRVAAYECECIFLTDEAGHRLELIIAGPGGGPRKLRPGLHHLAFECDRLDRRAAEWAELGIPLVEPAPVTGAVGLLINFLAPVYTRGVRVELVQEPADWPRCRGLAAETAARLPPSANVPPPANGRG
jgi:methylmalonyl-CoA/ethylmalonyl-CoA epimerase